MEWDNRLTHYFGLFWVLELLLGYLANPSAKSDAIFLLSDPDFLQRQWNSTPTSLSFETERRQADNRHSHWRLSHCKCVSPTNETMVTLDYMVCMDQSLRHQPNQQQLDIINTTEKTTAQNKKHESNVQYVLYCLIFTANKNAINNQSWRPSAMHKLTLATDAIGS